MDRYKQSYKQTDRKQLQREEEEMQVASSPSRTIHQLQTPARLRNSQSHQQNVSTPHQRSPEENQQNMKNISQTGQTEDSSPSIFTTLSTSFSKFFKICDSNVEQEKELDNELGFNIDEKKPLLQKNPLLSIINGQNIDGSWDQKEFLKNLCKRPEVAEGLSSWWNENIVITYVALQWLRKNRPEYTSSKFFLKGQEWLAKTLQQKKIPKEKYQVIEIKTGA